MQSLSKKKIKIIMCSLGAIVLSLILVLSGIGIYLKVSQKEEKPSVEVGPLDFSIDAWDGTTDYMNFNENYAGRGNFTKTINSAESFVHFIQEVNSGNDFNNYTIYLNSSIDLKGQEIPSIGNETYQFKGTFDGGFYTIYNAKINAHGLFEHTEDATIKNLGLYNCGVSLINKAINTNIENTFVRFGNGNLVGEYISNNGSHYINNSFVDTAGNGLISKIDTNKSSENAVAISNCYYTNGNNAILEELGEVYVVADDVVKATTETDFSDWSYSSEYASNKEWCEYDYLTEENKLDFNHPIQSGFAKVYLTGSCYESVMVSGDTVVDANNLSAAFEEASKEDEAEINLLVEKIFMEARAEIETDSTITVNAVKDTTIVRGENNLDSMFVGHGSSKIVLGNVGASAVSDGVEVPTITLDGGKDNTEANSVESGALVVANGAEVQIGDNVILKDNINNNVKYGGGVLLINADENSTINAQIQNCHADYAGGGICVVGALPQNLGHVRNCSTKGNGGAVALLKKFTSAASIQAIKDIYGHNVNIEPMSASTDVVCTISNTAFIDNTATFGGAIYADADTTLCVENVTFENNISTNNGGSIYSLGTININNDLLIVNKEIDSLGYSEIYVGGKIILNADINYLNMSSNSAAIGLKEDTYIDLFKNDINNIKVYKENIAEYTDGNMSGYIFKKCSSVQVMSLEVAENEETFVQDTTFDVVNMPETCSLTLSGDDGIVSTLAAININGLSPTTLNINVGSSGKFTASYTNATAFSALSKDTSIATVSMATATGSSSIGTVQGIKAGSTTITVTASIQNSSGTFTRATVGTLTVTVTKITPRITLSTTSLSCYAGGMAVSGGTASLTVSVNADGALKAIAASGTTSSGAATVKWANQSVTSGASVTQIYYGTDVGVKYSQFSFTPSDTDTYNTVTSAVITITIKQTSLTVPSQSGTLTYNGSSQSPSWNFYKTSCMTISLQTAAVDAGSYTAKFTLSSTTNYKWSDGTTSAKSITWKIAKAAISPTISMSSYMYGTTIPTPTVSGNKGGGAVTYYYSSSSAGTYSTWTTSTELNAGEYYLKATIAATTNYLSATTSSTTFSVMQATASNPVGGSFADIVFSNEGVPGPLMRTYIANMAGTFKFVSNNTNIVTLSKDNSTYSSSVTKTVSAGGEFSVYFKGVGSGSTTITMTFTPTDTNYEVKTESIYVVYKKTPTLTLSKREVALRSATSTYIVTCQSDFVGSFTVTSSNTSVVTVSSQSSFVQSVSANDGSNLNVQPLIFNDFSNSSEVQPLALNSYNYLACTITMVSNGSASIYIKFTPASSSMVNSVSTSISVLKYITVTFNANGGSCSTTTTEVTSGKTYATGTFPTPTKVGYSFNGWYYNGSRVTSASTIKSSLDHTLTASWGTNGITGDGGSQVESSKTVYPQPGSTLIYVGEFTATGGSGSYTYSVSSSSYFGLSTSSSATSTSSSVTSNGTVYLYFISTIAGTHKTTITATDQNNGTTATSGEFVVNSYYYCLSLKNESATATQTVYPRYRSINVYTGTQSNTLDSIEIPIRTGQTFMGWYTSTSGGTKVINSDGTLVASVSGYTNSSSQWAFTQNRTLYEVWNMTSYTVTLDPDGGQCSPTSITVVYTTPYSGLPTPTKDGYVFNGWKYNGVTVSNGDSMNVAEDHTLVASWTAEISGGTQDVYVEDIYLNPTGSSLILVGSYQATGGSGTFTYSLTGSDRFGMYIAETIESEDLLGNNLENITGAIYIYFRVSTVGTYTCQVVATDQNTGDVSDPVSFTVDVHRYALRLYDSTGSTLKQTVYPEVGTTTVYSGSQSSTTTSINIPSEKTGYAFSGWTTSPNGAGSFVLDDAADLCYVSGYTSSTYQWAMTSHRNIYECWDKQTVQIQVVAMEDWAEQINSAVVTSANGNIETYSPINNILSFNGNIGDEITISFTVIEPTFGMWSWQRYDDGVKVATYAYNTYDCDGVVQTDGVFTFKHTLTAEDVEISTIKYEAISSGYLRYHAVTNFNVDDISGGQIAQTSANSWGTNLQNGFVSDAQINLNARSCEGYEFVGWYLRVIPTLDNYELANYLYYSAEDCTSSTVDGYTEYINSFSPENFNPYDNARGGGNIYALFIKNSSVSVDPNGGSYNGSTSVQLVGSNVFGKRVEITNPTREGYIFSGWKIICGSLECLCMGGGSVEVSGSKSTYTYGDAEGEDDGKYILQAVWLETEQIVTFDYNDGSGKTEEKAVIYAHKYGEVPNPTREGYTFDGWYGKNLFDINKPFDNTINCSCSIDGATLLVDPTENKLTRVVAELNVKPNTDYIVSGSFEIFNVDEYSGATSLVIRAGATGGISVAAQGFPIQSGEQIINKKFNSGEYSTLYLWFYFNQKNDGTQLNGNSYGIYKNIQIEEGSIATDYEAYVNSECPVNKDTIVRTPYNHTLYAKWVLNNIEVTFDANGGDVIPTSKIVAYGASYGELPTPSRLGYSFVGWYGKNLFDGVFEMGAISADTGVFTGYTTATSISTKNFISIQPNTTYTMTNGILNKLHKTRFYDSNFNYIGYAIASGNFLASGDSTSNLIRTGTTPANAYYMKFELDFDDHQTGLDVINGVYKYQFELGETATDYVPFCNASGYIRSESNVGVDYDHTLTAAWTQNMYNVIVNVNNSEFGAVNDTKTGEVSTITLSLPYGTTLSKNDNVLTLGNIVITATPAASTVQYTYSFEKWVGMRWYVTGDMTITANFTRHLRMYTLTIQSNNTAYGTVSHSSITAPYGSTIYVNENVLTVSSGYSVALTTPQTHLNDYSFIGWFVDEDFVEGRLVTGNMTIIAKFEMSPRIYTVTIEVPNSQFGSIAEGSGEAQTMITIEVSYGTEIVVDGNTISVGGKVITATPVEGCVFVMWEGVVGLVEESTLIRVNFMQE